ncbi:Rne/Rng family ribonuclease [Moraxella haemolytica]|uniref:Rne/Rng family ribonuclease n=1 Tax=Moraxella haemolytica TaxID=2904119 RepID=UPI002543A443|nr:Rne/Rng family ribonuclease [Moraxella sp. ZY171148]WII95063.1 Rne/Rng family ribonuclease [Moraxella sp. ZY171148]
MKRILINATHNEEIRVALCKDNHLYDFDLENRTREQKKANIYKGHITRVEPSLEAAFVEYGSVRQGFLPLREIAPEYLHGNVREDNIKQLLKEGDEVIVQVEKEERGNKGAALSTYISLAGRYLVLMPNNSKAGGISRQISGKVREEMKQIIASLSIPKGMSVIVRTAGLGKGFDDLQNDLNHLLDIWSSILDQNKKRPSPCLVHQEAGVVTRAVRDYLRDDISEVWIDSEHAYNEAANFIAAVMPAQLDKLRKYTEYEPMFARFGIERQIETAYQREVRLPSGGSIVIDQTEAMVSIDINSSKSTKGSDVSETAYHTNLEAADEIARQLRLRDMGGLIVIDFIDMNDPRHQKDVEKRLIDATRHDRARVQFAEISKFGLMEMSRQRLRPSLEESTGYICPRCHGNGMIRDLRSLALSIMRQIEQISLKERTGEIQAEVPTEIAAFLLNEKRESLVYLEQDSGTRITILPHAHLESPNFSLHFNPDGFAPSSYERIVNAEEEEMEDRGYEVNWQAHNETGDADVPNRWQKAQTNTDHRKKTADRPDKQDKQPKTQAEPQSQPQVAAWLSNLFAPKPQAKLAGSLNNSSAAAIESIVNGGGISLGASGVATIINQDSSPKKETHQRPTKDKAEREETQERRSRHKKTKKETPTEETKDLKTQKTDKTDKTDQKPKKEESAYPKREAGSRREARGEIVREETLTPENNRNLKKDHKKASEQHTKKHAEHSNPDEVVVSIKAIPTNESAGKVVHLSLDNSKPTTQAQADISDDDSHTAPTKAVVETVVETVAKFSSDDTQSVQAQADHAPANHKITTDDTLQQDEPKQPVVEQTQPKQVARSVFTHDARISKLALQMDKATNDPRVVMAVLQTTAPISGTAGEFITRVLGQNVGGDFITNFTNAVAKHRTTTDEVFSFANYGYVPLPEDYLAAFDRQTSVASRISTPQGKTEVALPRTTQRADNDPRGQLTETLGTSDDHQEPSDKNTAQDDLMTTAITAEQTPAQMPKVQDAPQAKQAPTEHNSQQEQAISTQTEQDSPSEHQKMFDQIDKAIEQIKETADDVTQTINNKIADLFDGLDDPQEDKNHQAKQDEQPAEQPITPKADDSTKKPKKRTNSYKDMIENVAGQLLPQVGILNLAQPKPAKTRIKKTAGKGDNKPKSEVRKAGSKVAKAKAETKKPKDE